MRKLTLLLLLFIYSCNTTTQSSNADTPNTANIEDNFLGSWKFYSSNDGKENDHSMDGIICELSRFRDTKETFVFHLFTGNDLVLSIKDDSTMVGENGNMSVSFNNSTGRLKLFINKSSTMEFTKLK